jgi:hypothetical protein
MIALTRVTKLHILVFQLLCVCLVPDIVNALPGNDNVLLFLIHCASTPPSAPWLIYGRYEAEEILQLKSKNPMAIAPP